MRVQVPTRPELWACVSRRGRTDVRATAGDVDSLTQPPLCSGTTQEEVLPTSQHVLLRSPRLCRRTHTSLRMPAEDLFDDIRSPNAALRYPHENAVLSAAEEILSAQGLQRTPVAYFGVFLMTMQADGEKVTQAVSAAMLALLERAMSSEQVPQRLLLSKGPQIASSLVGVANAHAESVQVLSSALACAARLLSAASVTKQAPTPDTLKLFNWMLAFVVHPSPQVRGKGQTTCRAALEQRPVFFLVLLEPGLVHLDKGGIRRRKHLNHVIIPSPKVRQFVGPDRNEISLQKSWRLT